MNQADIFAFVVDVLNASGMDYMIVGSVASTAYGKPRLTYGMDILISVRKENIDDFKKNLMKAGMSIRK